MTNKALMNIRHVLVPVILSLLWSDNLVGAELRRYTGDIPHSDSYAVFGNMQDDTQFYFLPLRVRPALDEHNNPRFGFVYSGYNPKTDSVDSASLTCTLTFVVVPEELNEIKAYIESKRTAGAISLSAIPAIGYRVELITDSQRKKKQQPSLLDSGLTTLDSSIAINVSLESLPASEIFDLMNKDVGRGGILVTTDVETMLMPDYLNVEPQLLINILSKLGKWSTAKSLDSLTTVLADDLAFKRNSERLILHNWLERTLKEPDLLLFEAGKLGPGWDLADPELQAAIRKNPPLELPLNDRAKQTDNYYALLTFATYCSSLAPKILDLDSGQQGCRAAKSL